MEVVVAEQEGDMVLEINTLELLLQNVSALDLPEAILCSGC